MRPRSTPPWPSIPAEPAELARAGESLARLGQAIDTYQAHDQPPYPAYRGTLGSGPLPQDGIGLEGMAAELAEAVAHGSRIGAPGWAGFITTGSTTGPALAQAARAFAGGQRYLLHAFNALEHRSLGWLAELCGLPVDAAGVYSSGGSTANLVGLGAARQAAYERRGVDAAEDGLPVGMPGRIYSSALAHRTIHRSAAVLGLGRRSVRAIPVNEHGRIRLDALDEAISADVRAGILPIATVAIAGTTDTGFVDDIRGVVEIAHRHGCWVHVDGAYGLIANASPALAPLFDGVEQADSWIVDPHKWLATGVGVAATYVRDGDLLTRAFAEGKAAYLEGAFAEDDAVAEWDGFGGPWADQGVELSAPPRGVMVWAILREIGRAGVVARVDRHVAFARRVAQRAAEHPRLELLIEPQLSIACFRYLPAGGDRSAARVNEVNGLIMNRLRREAGFVPTSTVLDGKTAIRPCYVNPHTTEREVDGLVAAVVRFGDELTSG